MKQILFLLIPMISFSQDAFTLQNLINNAEEGETLSISSGFYYPEIIINKSIYLECINDNGPCTIDGSYSGGGTITILSSDVTVNGFEILGDNETTAGVIINPNCSNVSLLNNNIYGMQMSNPGNDSPLSYGILSYGTIDQSPTNLHFENNQIHDINGCGISLGTYSGNVTIVNNDIYDISPVIILGELSSIGIQAQLAEYVTIENNDFSNLSIGSNLIMTNGELQNNNYEGTFSLLTHSALFNIYFLDNLEWWSVEGAIEFMGIPFNIISYINSLENAILIAAQNGSNIISSNGTTYDNNGNILLSGCTDSEACNYNENAFNDDDSCIYASGCDSCYGPNDGTGYVLDGDLDNDGICDEFEIYGCDNIDACNYNSFATENDGNCTFPGNDCELEGGIIGMYNDLCECIENNVSIIETHDKKQLLHIINIIGQSTSHRTMNLYIYDDGSIEKKYLLK